MIKCLTFSNHGLVNQCPLVAAYYTNSLWVFHSEHIALASVLTGLLHSRLSSSSLRVLSYTIQLLADRL